MNILVWIIFGALVGWIASLVMGTNGEQGGFANVVVGIVGSLIGGFVSQALGMQGVNGFNIMSFITALVGAIVLLAIVRMFSRRNSV